MTIDMIVEGVVDGKQGSKLKTIVPQTELNMVSSMELLTTIHCYTLHILQLIPISALFILQGQSLAFYRSHSLTVETHPIEGRSHAPTVGPMGPMRS